MRSSWIVVVACAACSGTPGAPTPPVAATTAIDGGVAVVPVEPADATPTDPGHEQFQVVIGEPTTSRDGLVVTLDSRGHKHAVGGGTTSRFELTIARGDDVHEVSYSFSDDSVAWYIEGIAHGNVFMVQSLFDLDDTHTILTEPSDLDKNQRRLVTLIPTDASPLDDIDAAEAAWEIADAEAERRGCSGSSRSSSHSDGSFEFFIGEDGAVLCKLVVGVYSGHVIFVAP